MLDNDYAIMSSLLPVRYFAAQFIDLVFALACNRYRNRLQNTKKCG
jgi:hypothetical protein